MLSFSKTDWEVGEIKYSNAAPATVIKLKAITE
jgi:hypothetical protein